MLIFHLTRPTRCCLVPAMARKLRPEFTGAIYHVINRGNRRVGPFGAARTRDAFEAGLFDACVRSRWVLHARVRCEARLTAGLRLVGKRKAKPAAESKGAPWKIAVAAWMKQTTEASNGWLAERLQMGSATRVSQVVGAVARQPQSPAAQIRRGMSESLAT